MILLLSPDNRKAIWFPVHRAIGVRASVGGTAEHIDNSHAYCRRFANVLRSLRSWLGADQCRLGDLRHGFRIHRSKCLYMWYKFGFIPLVLSGEVMKRSGWVRVRITERSIGGRPIRNRDTPNNSGTVEFAKARSDCRRAPPSSNSLTFIDIQTPWRWGSADVFAQLVFSGSPICHLSQSPTPRPNAFNRPPNNFSNKLTELATGPGIIPRVPKSYAFPTKSMSHALQIIPSAMILVMTSLLGLQWSEKPQAVPSNAISWTPNVHWYLTHLKLVF